MSLCDDYHGPLNSSCGSRMSWSNQGSTSAVLLGGAFLRRGERTFRHSPRSKIQAGVCVDLRVKMCVGHPSPTSWVWLFQPISTHGGTLLVAPKSNSNTSIPDSQPRHHHFWCKDFRFLEHVPSFLQIIKTRCFLSPRLAALFPSDFREFLIL